MAQLVHSHKHRQALRFAKSVARSATEPLLSIHCPHVSSYSPGASVRGLRKAPSDCLRLGPPAERYGPAKAGPFIAAMGGHNLAR